MCELGPENPGVHMDTRVLVVGCGGIGGLVAANLGALGVEVHGLSRNQAVVDAVAARGFRLVGEGAPRSVPGRVHQRLPEDIGRFDYILLATQPTDVEEAARQTAPYLAEQGNMVCFQNGLCEARVAEVIGDPGRVIGGIVAWGGQMVEPGLYDRTSGGGFVLGRYDGSVDEPLRRLSQLLECIGPVDLTTNLAGARWSKLALNCAVSSLGTLNGSTLGTVVLQRHARRLALEIMTETVRVARAAGVKLEKVSGTLDLEWISLDGNPRVGLPARHGLILAVGARYRRLKSSMLRAIEAGRPPAIDFLNGEVVRWARRYEIETPVNAAITKAVWGISEGTYAPGKPLIEKLYQETR